MTTTIINATIHTVGPLSIAMPVAEGGTANAYKNFPVMARGVDEDGNKKLTGYLPATTLRGFLRRAVVLREMKKAASAGTPYSLQRAYTELIGQDAESERAEEEKINPVVLRKAREASPILDLFGSGLGIKSRLMVSHFLPATNVLPDAFTGVRKDLEDTDGVLDMVNAADVETYLGRSEANSRRASAEGLLSQLKRKLSAAKRKNEPADDLEKQVAEMQAKADALKAQMGDMQVSSRTLVGHYALPADLDLKGRLVINNSKDADLEMIEHALDELSLRPVLGAQSARGCGEISGTFDITVDGVLRKRVTIGGYKPARTVIFSDPAGGERAA
jgi:hypothetical protein